MRRLAAVCAVIALSALVISMVAPAVSQTADRKVILRFAEPTSDDEKYSKVIDIGKKGESIGDYVLLKAEPIYNLSLSKRVGVARGSHVLVQRRPVSVLKEDRTFAFGKGRITVEGPDILGKPICHPGCHWRNGSL